MFINPCGVLLGVAESEVNHYVHLTGAASSVPFLIIVAVLALRGSTLPLRGYLTDRLPEVGMGRINPAVAAGGFAAAVLLLSFGLSDDALSAAIVCLAVGIILLSLVVLTGYSGQLSLAQFALAGIGALLAARLVEAGDFPFVVALVLGVAGTAIVGLVFALPALRTRGVELAVVTLGLGASAQALLFNNSDVTSSAAGTPVGSPHIFGVDISALDHPVRYGLFVLALFSLCALAVANLRRGRAGRRLLAVRTNERAAAAMGISVTGAKLHAFALAGALAGLGGIVLGFRATTVIYDEFGPLASINAVANAVIGGIGYVIGAVLAPGSLGQELSGSDAADAARYLPLISGLLLLLLLVAAPNGIAHAGRRLARRLAATRAQPTDLEAVRDEVEQRRVDPRTLTVEDLTVRYGGVVAVDGVRFAVAPGQVVGLIGPNGAGKSSVIDAVSGFTRAGGRVTLDGEPVSGWSPHRRARAGLVRSFQSLELFEDMTVLENLQAASDPRDAGAAITDLIRPGQTALPPMAVAAIKEFELEPLLDRRPPELSYGQRRLLAIARAAAMQPSVVLLDEPAAGLDEGESQELAMLVRRLADEWGIAVLVIEHDMAFVMGICDHVVVIDFGRQIAEGTPAQVQDDPAAIAAYLGEETPATATTGADS